MRAFKSTSNGDADPSPAPEAPKSGIWEWIREGARWMLGGKGREEEVEVGGSESKRSEGKEGVKQRRWRYDENAWEEHAGLESVESVLAEMEMM